MLELVIAFLVKSTVILALALCICSLKRLSAAERHAVAGTSLVAVAVLALLTLLPDRVRVPEWSVTLPVIPIEDAPMLAGDLNSVDASVAATVASPATPAGTIDWRFWGLSIYVVVAVALGLSTFGGRRRVAHYARRLPVWRGRAFAPNTIDVRADEGGTPWTWGHVRPVVVLPRDFENWPRQEQDAVLAHELGHIRRRDCLTDGLSRWLCNLFWFQPLMWVVWLRQRRYAEEACDDAALERGTDPCDYAETLLAVARRNHQARPMGLYAGRGSLRVRLRSILHRGIRRSRMTFVKRGLLSAGAMGVVLAASACSVVTNRFEDAGQQMIESAADEIVRDIFVFVYRTHLTGPTPEDASYLEDRLTNVSRARPVYAERLGIQRGHREIEAVVIAVEGLSPWAETSARAVWPLEQGEYIAPCDHREGRRVVVIGGPVRDRLFGVGEAALGREIVIHGQPFRVKGVLAPHPPFVGIDGFPDPDHLATALATRVYVPFRAGTEMFFGGVRPGQLRVAVHDQGGVNETATEIRDLLQVRYGDPWKVIVETLTVPTPDGV